MRVRHWLPRPTSGARAVSLGGAEKIEARRHELRISRQSLVARVGGAGICWLESALDKKLARQIEIGSSQIREGVPSRRPRHDGNNRGASFPALGRQRAMMHLHPAAHNLEADSTGGERCLERHAAAIVRDL